LQRGKSKAQKRDEIRGIYTRPKLMTSSGNSLLRMAAFMSQIPSVHSADVTIGTVMRTVRPSFAHTACNLATIYFAVWAFTILFKVPTPFVVAKYTVKKIVLFVKRCRGHGRCQARNKFKNLNF
jgi:hypothetical protein